MLQFWQKLQDYLVTNFQVNPATAATIIISLLVFFLGFLIRGMINEFGKMWRRWTIRHLFIDNLKGLKTQIQKQQQGFAETAKSLDMTSDSTWVFHKATLYRISVLKELKYNDVYKAHFLGIKSLYFFLKGKDFRYKRREGFNKVWENNASLEFWSDKAFKDFEKHLNDYNDKLGDWNKAASELRLTWVDFIVRHRNKELSEKEVEFLDRLQAILAAYNLETQDEQEKVNPYKVHTTLVRPIKEISDYYERFIDTQTLIEASLKSVNTYIELNTFVQNVKSQMEDYKDMMEEMLKSTDEAIKHLSK